MLRSVRAPRAMLPCCDMPRCRRLRACRRADARSQNAARCRLLLFTRRLPRRVSAATRDAVAAATRYFHADVADALMPMPLMRDDAPPFHAAARRMRLFVAPVFRCVRARRRGRIKALSLRQPAWLMCREQARRR